MLNPFDLTLCGILHMVSRNTGQEIVIIEEVGKTQSNPREITSIICHAFVHS